MFGDSRRVYTVAQVLVVVASYVVPYTVLRGSRDLSLYVYWTLLTVVSIVLALVRLYRRPGLS